jgi:hypothetical protein
VHRRKERRDSGVVSDAALAAFLVTAKRQTYAAGSADADVEPLLPGSRQLEYREGDLLYRDIYFGNAYFVGQETVYEGPTAVWAMAYAGGVMPDSPLTTGDLYRFLRAALQRVQEDRPYRGPRQCSDAPLTYSDDSQGDMGCFRGTETITFGGQAVYHLQYSGGLLR